MSKDETGFDWDAVKKRILEKDYDSPWPALEAALIDLHERVKALEAAQQTKVVVREPTRLSDLADDDDCNGTGRAR